MGNEVECIWRSALAAWQRQWENSEGRREMTIENWRENARKGESKIIIIIKIKTTIALKMICAATRGTSDEPCSVRFNNCRQLHARPYVASYADDGPGYYYTRTLSIVNTRLLIIRSPESGDNNNAARRRLNVRAVRFVLACPRTAIAHDRINILFDFHAGLRGAMTSRGGKRGCVFVLNGGGTCFGIRSMWNKKTQRLTSTGGGGGRHV